NHEDKSIFDSFPGSGEALGPRLLCAWGTDRERYDSADSMQQYSGIAPVTKASGQSKMVIRRLACPKFLLQTFHEFANSSRRLSIWAQAYYEMLRERGKSHHTAIRSLAFKWIRIMYCCWQNRIPYDEIKYIQALKRTNSPLLKFV
ncbi:MAG: transposase, partial [Desulfobulbaceae bacterium]|nr:transposase [Desulfobulbaceae bacterium]